MNYDIHVFKDVISGLWTYSITINNVTIFSDYGWSKKETAEKYATKSFKLRND